MSDSKTKIEVNIDNKGTYCFVSKLNKEELGQALDCIYRDDKAFHIGFTYESGRVCYLPKSLLNNAIVTLTDYDK